MIPFLFALTFSILLALVFVIPGLFLFYRWIAIFAVSDFNTHIMKVPTFYSTRREGSEVAYVFLISVVGVIFGGIHCAGWFFNFPSHDEAMLWRVSSAVLTGIAILVPLFTYLSRKFLGRIRWGIPAFTTILLVYGVVSRLLLLVEAFISLRYLTPSGKYQKNLMGFAGLFQK